MRRRTMMMTLIGVMMMGVMASLAPAQSVAYSFGAKRFDPIVSASVFPVRKTPLGDLDGLAFAGYRKDGDEQTDTVPVGIGLAKSFPFGQNLSFQVGLQATVVKGSPVDGGFLAGFQYRPTASSAFTFGPTHRGGAAMTYRVKF